ncbi:hypothetical protein [Denitromonas iodatirespirans]|uniref:Uncharacterized protein n=1 Tax=Denitromonas iodatirespirans TaxID=2795389 RepID=A0A944HB78_DENI1|nr:hypothetical protein [Denitromonas iodatirespirans]MBT0960041.1 hypothetical protein [Denitromonas iodatirespirans]
MPLRRHHPDAPRIRLILTLLAALGLGGCASIQNAVDTVKAKLPAPAAPAAEVDADTPDTPRTEPARPAPKPVRKAVAPPPAPSAPPPAPAPAPAAPVAKIAGPAWLAQCAAVQVAGGVARCDADRLLARPSATVQVFTRDPALAVKSADGDITLRPGLPHRYRLFVLP